MLDLFISFFLYSLFVFDRFMIPSKAFIRK